MYHYMHTAIRILQLNPSQTVPIILSPFTLILFTLDIKEA